jgi:hypothetical protein
MGNRIFFRLRDSGLFLLRFWFLLGNLAPDLCLSFIFRRHEYAASGMSLKRMMHRLFEGRFNPHSVLFSYCLGIISHYVCDYFCYSHHPSFKGGLRKHIVYEIRQRPKPQDACFFFSPGDREMSFHDMTGMLDEYLTRHNATRSQSGGVYDDINPAVNAAAQLNSTICFSAEKLYYPDMLSTPPEEQLPETGSITAWSGMAYR